MSVVQTHTTATQMQRAWILMDRSTASATKVTAETGNIVKVNDYPETTMFRIYLRQRLMLE